jgi:hypothetical protein
MAVPAADTSRLAGADSRPLAGGIEAAVAPVAGTAAAAADIVGAVVWVAVAATAGIAAEGTVAAHKTEQGTAMEAALVIHEAAVNPALASEIFVASVPPVFAFEPAKPRRA